MSAVVRLLPAGPTAVLAEVDGPAAPLVDAARALPGVSDAVPAATTVLVTVDRPADLAAVRAALAGLTALADDRPDGPPVVLEVHYDGPDLAAVAERTGLTPAEVVRRHAAPLYTVDFLGFAPGFGYLSGLDPALRLPRLDTPRTAVPAGSVAIAEDRSAVYPRSSPGGWWLLGRTERVLFDPAATPPTPLHPGARVRFVPA